MKRELIEVARGVDGIVFREMVALLKELYPRRKAIMYQLNPNEDGKRTYVIKWNLTELEYSVFCNIYNTDKFAK